MTRMKLSFTLPERLVASVLGNNSASADTQYIQCPMGKIKVEVATGFPEGWENKPVERTLQSVNVRRIEGRGQFLQCNYGAGIVISSKAPANKTCEIEDRTGFKCSDAVSNRPKTLRAADMPRLLSTLQYLRLTLNLAIFRGHRRPAPSPIGL